MSVSAPSRDALRTAAAVLLTLLGLSGVVARTLGSGALDHVGQLFLFAPQPGVFTDRYISATVEVFPETGERPIRAVVLDRDVRGRLEGPQHRKDAYTLAILGATFLPGPLSEAVMRFGLCRGGPLGRAMGLPMDLSSFDVRISFPSAPEYAPDMFRVSCTPDPDPQLVP